MVKFTATIHQFDAKGEKTGWTYIEIPADIAQQLKPDNKKSFRIMGKLDKYPISGIAVLPMGNGGFIMPLNASMRKGTHKKKDGMLEVQLTLDTNQLVVPTAFLECLADEPEAETFFNQLKPSQRNYYIKWLGGVKSEEAVAKRMAQAVTALSKKQDFVAMVHNYKALRENVEK